MFVAKTKLSIFGAVGVLLTVFLLYRMAELATQQRQPQSIRYLDSKEFTNYTLLESLLQSDTTIAPNTLNLKGMLLPSHQQDLQSLKKLAFQTRLTNDLKISVIIPFINSSSTTALSDQIDSVLQQTLVPTFIYIAYSTAEEQQRQTIIDKLIKEKQEKYHLDHMIDTLSITAMHENEETMWYTEIEPQVYVDHDYVVILRDSSVIPGIGYLDFMIRLLEAPEFNQVIVIGTEREDTGDNCQSSRAEYVNSLQDIWTLRAKGMTNKIDLSTALLVPSHSKELGLTGNINKQRLVLCDDEAETKDLTLPVVMIYMDSDDINNNSSEPLCELACRLAQEKNGVTTVHLVTTANIKVKGCNSISTHQIARKDDFIRLVHQYKPRIVLSSNSKEELIGNDMKTTFIRLCKEQIIQVMDWMPTLTLESLSNWNMPSIKIIITTSGEKRSSQVKRTLDSIKDADYLGDKVDLLVSMDEKTDELTRKFVNGFLWNMGQGEKTIRHRISPANQMQIFTESWYPSNDHEYGVLLDDRTELSPSFYIWLKYSLLKYRYNGSNSSARHLFGISLYSPRIVDTLLKGHALLNLSAATTASAYLMQQPTGFGALYFPEHWKEFHDYITARITDQLIVKRGSKNNHLFKDSLLTISKSDKWVNSWRKYFDEIIYMRGYVMLYPSSGDSFSTVHIELTNKKKQHHDLVDTLYNVPLLAKKQWLGRELPDLESLPVLDLHGKTVRNEKVLIERGHALQRKFSACEPKLDHQNDPSDMLCPFSRLIQVRVDLQQGPVQKIDLFI